MRYAAALLVTLVACASTDPAKNEAIEASADAAVDDAALDGRDADADATVDAGVSAWCASNGLHFFCDDFDEDSLAHNWDDSVGQHGALSLDTKTATSSPYALLARTSALATGDVARVALSKSIVDPAPHQHFAFDFAADVVPGGASVVVFDLHLLGPTGTVIETLSLRVSGTMAFLDDSAPNAMGGADFTASHAFALPALAISDRWSRVAIDLDLGDDAAVGVGVVSLSVDANVVVDRAAMSPVSQAAEPEIVLGIVSGTGPSSAVAVRFDDFTFDTIP